MCKSHFFYIYCLEITCAKVSALNNKKLAVSDRRGRGHW